MKQFDTEKWNAWVEEQGGWKAVVEIAKDKARQLNCDDHVKDLAHIGGLYKEYPERYTPFGGRDSALLWFCLNLNIDDFLKAETVDGKTAAHILIHGGKVVGVKNKKTYDLKSLLGCTYFDVNYDYEVISWGEYKHDK